MMPDDASGRSKEGKSAKSRKRRLLTLLCRLILLILAVAGCSVIALEVTEPLARPGACIQCHEMEDVYESWKQSPHHTNPRGLQVTCVSCHLPPREEYLSHITSKAWSGAKDACVHFFGEYDAEAARENVRRTMPSRRCMHCHSNLLAKPKSYPLGIVHEAAVKRIPDRNHRCIACHESLHGPKKTIVKKVYKEADNAFCLDCHVYFKPEPFVLQHQAAGVGCEKCHGESIEHAGDEEHTTPPTTMYIKSAVNASCMAKGCHSDKRMKEEIGHRPFYAGAHAEKKYCTDCHGMHRLDKRTRKWDKTTRKFIWMDGYPVKDDEQDEKDSAATSQPSTQTATTRP